jgi:hypothetical protein
MSLAQISLTLDRGLTWPEYFFNCHSSVISQTEINHNKKCVVLALEPIDSIVLNYVNKSQNETIVDNTGNIVQDQTLEITSVYMDHILLDSTVTQQMSQYLPRYHQGFVDHCQQHNISISHDAQHQMKFWHNGQWSLQCGDDFWSRYQTVRRSLYATSNLNLTGYTHEDIKQKLQDLKRLLNQHVK